MLCSNLLCFDSDFAVFGILFSCLRLQECSFSPGKRVFSEVEHRVWLVWCLVRCVRSQWSVCCFVCVFLFCLFGIFLNFALFFDFLTQNEVS